MIIVNSNVLYVIFQTCWGLCLRCAPRRELRIEACVRACVREEEEEAIFSASSKERERPF